MNNYLYKQPFRRIEMGYVRMYFILSNAFVIRKIND